MHMKLHRQTTLKRIESVHNVKEKGGWKTNQKGDNCFECGINFVGYQTFMGEKMDDEKWYNNAIEII